MPKLTNYQRKELSRLFHATIDPFFRAIELTDAPETQAPRIALFYVLWEHLAWLWCPDSKRQLKDAGKTFRRFTEDFLLVRPDFKKMLDATGIDTDALWTERNKQLHSGRMIPHPHERSDSSARNIFHGDSPNESVQRLLRRLVRSNRGVKFRAGLIDLGILKRTLKAAATALKEALLADAQRGKVALQRLRLRGTTQLGHLIRRRALKKMEQLDLLGRGDPRPDLFPLPDGGMRYVFQRGAVAFSAMEFESMLEHLATNSASEKS